VTVATFTTSLDASVARGYLESAGIEAFVPGEDLGTLSLNRGWISTCELQVFERDRERAIEALKAGSSA